MVPWTIPGRVGNHPHHRLQQPELREDTSMAKTIIITGASSGFGAMTTVRCVDAA